MTQMTNEIAVIFHLSILEFVLSSYAGYLCTHSVIVAKKDGCRNYKRGIFIFFYFIDLLANYKLLPGNQTPECY